MMVDSVKARQIECLLRLDAVTGSIADILEFLVHERLASKDEILKIRQAPMPAKELQVLMHALKVNEKFQLLEYAWQILPSEHIVVTIVTDNARKEFTYTT